jgi:hypothetical protein
MKKPNQNSNKKWNKRRIIEKDQNENNIILYKKSNFEIDYSFSNGENFVLNKSPLFSFIPDSNIEEIDSEFKNNVATKTEIDIIDSEPIITGKIYFYKFRQY